MKQYMKMSDYFTGEMQPEDVVILDGGLATIIYTSEEAAVHAINSHDELVEMNKELIDIINRVIDTSKELEGKAGTSSWTDGYKQCAIDTGSALSEMIDKYKSKGGAA